MENDNTVKSKKTKKIIIGIIVAIAIIYGIFMVYKLIKNPSNTFMVENGIISEEETVSGYIIRDEEVIEEKNKKTIIKIKEEGQRVAKGDSVFRYYSEKEGELESKISELDGKIQAVLENEENLLPNDKKLLESQIENELDKVNGQNEISKLAEYKKTISSYITKKAKIIGENSPSGSYLKGLIEERTSYEEKLKQESKYITAPSAGMVSYKIDGLEKVLTTDNLNTFNKQFLQDLDLKVGKAIASSDVTAKIVNNYNNYIVFNSNSQEAKNAKVNDKANIKVQNDEAIVAKIQNIIEEDDGSRTIAISVEKNIEELLSYRRISLDIIWWSASGYRVPNSAIKEIDNVTYVVRNRNGYLNKMAVKVLKKGEDYSIVDSYSRDELLNLGLSSKEISDLKTLTLYDEILLNPKDEQLLQ